MNIYEKLQEYDQRISDCQKEIDKHQNEIKQIQADRNQFIKDHRLKAGNATLGLTNKGDFFVRGKESVSSYARVVTAYIKPTDIPEFWAIIKRFFDDDPSLKAGITKEKKKTAKNDPYKFMDLEEK